MCLRLITFQRIKPGIPGTGTCRDSNSNVRMIPLHKQHQLIKVVLATQLQLHFAPHHRQTGLSVSPRIVAPRISTHHRAPGRVIPQTRHATARNFGNSAPPHIYVLNIKYSVMVLFAHKTRAYPRRRRRRRRQRPPGIYNIGEIRPSTGGTFVNLSADSGSRPLMCSRVCGHTRTACARMC